MKKVLFKAVPYSKDDVTLALESGVDGIIAPKEHLESITMLARCEVIDEAAIPCLDLDVKEDEAEAVVLMNKGRTVMLNRGWEIIPVENLLAHEQLSGKSGLLALEAVNAQEAMLAANILEKGVDTVIVPQLAIGAIKEIVNKIKSEQGSLDLTEAIITEISNVGLGHRVCVDTMSLFKTGQGMLVGNSAAFTFLVNAETEHNEFVASRPFRINAGAVHTYAVMPEDKTSYLEELDAGSEVLIVDHKGNTQTAVVGRLKVEKRPMLLIRAKAGDQEGTVFLQNAETIRLVQPDGAATSIVNLGPGDKILCRLDVAGRHFGMRIIEDITEN